MVIGAISAIGQLQHWPNVNDDNVFGGITAVFGALAYRSAKQIRLGMKEATTLRRGMELTLLLLVCIPTVLAISEPDGVVHRPWSALLIPIWTGVAYTVIRRKKIEPEVQTIG